MPTKRQVLDLLTRDELAALIDHHELIVWNRSAKAQMAETLDARGPALPALVAGLSRDRL